MHLTTLEVFAKIDGIGSASGLFLHEDLLYIIGDNSGYLNEYNIKTKKLRKIQILFDKILDQLENIPKSLKPDFEILCHNNNKLYMLGSGSTPKRNLMIEFDLETQKVIQKDLTNTYTKLKAIAKIDDQNFNLEGATFTGNEWLLFNRGNGIDAKNGIFKIQEVDLTKTKQAKFNPFKLPNIDHVESSFTDAVLVKNEIFFIATAEDTKSTYADGEILGSFIGSINLQTLKLTFSHKISDKHKFEGITLLSQNEHRTTFLLCEDRDSEELKTVIYKLILDH
ncbi:MULTISPECIES: hypothetical protein [unclassified Pedobacter]|uniref:DUF6929 family protein n=1 Tax=unclassified Pedobacter TaxID=2628915 RepID=UPI001DDA755C|nr:MULTISPECIES: hypothetical protein [unclassified Pedobacter]CAH0243579.1 hypothetical protein SRABI36_03032 [Pedobacter sp. Bi36]CAH0269286.1 hypothetical protein SRABI126_03432 [Pedobacter sp. Bi126]